MDEETFRWDNGIDRWDFRVGWNWARQQEKLNGNRISGGFNCSFQGSGFWIEMNWGRMISEAGQKDGEY